MENKTRIVCPENEDLATFMWKKIQEIAENSKGISDNLEKTLQKAYSSVCKCKTPIQSLKAFSEVKGVGKWILKQMKDFFETHVDTSEAEGMDEGDGVDEKGKKGKVSRRYVPQKNSVAYALLITLYRANSKGSDFMRKQELIDAAEASGLSRVPIMPEKGKGKLGSFGSSPREWYSGWNCMKTLVTKGLVVKSSNPAKYMLTPEGQEAAQNCLIRSGLIDSADDLAAAGGASNLQEHNSSELELVHTDSDREVPLQSSGLGVLKKDVDIPLKSIERFTRMGYSKDQVIRAFSKISETSENKDMSSLWPAVLCRLREEEVYGLNSNLREACLPTSSQADRVKEKSRKDTCGGANMPKASSAINSVRSSFTMEACSSNNSSSNGLKALANSLAMPPLNFGESFLDAYEIVLILDDREKFATQRSQGTKIVENIRSQFKIKIEVRKLAVGDAIWVARHKQLESEYVLDFIVERKTVDDLHSSIMDSRYKDQKLRLVRCGLKKLIYLVEGDLNTSEAAEALKTACFTTEILEGFDVHRTSGLGETLRKYGHLTRAIAHYYRSQSTDDKVKSIGVCPTFDEFIRRCQDLDKVTVGDVFAIQLMQVPQVTEDIAIAVLDLHPTLLSLAQAYSLLDGNACAQEEMLWKQSNYAVSAVASRNIFQLVWSD